MNPNIELVERLGDHSSYPLDIVLTLSRPQVIGFEQELCRQEGLKRGWDKNPGDSKMTFEQRCYHLADNHVGWLFKDMHDRQWYVLFSDGIAYFSLTHEMHEW